MHSRIRIVATAAVIVALLTAVARADQLYAVSGQDRYRVGTTLGSTQVIYSGTERLMIEHRGATRRFVSQIRYTRSDQGGTAVVHARFVQDLKPDGTFVDRTDEDPDFLSVLNQPFAVQLDAMTLRGLEHLHGMVPFAAQSPFGGAELHGYLRSAPPGPVDGDPAVGVRFEADGPMNGTLPDHPGGTLEGTLHMDGTAYYAQRGALLLELDATLSINGKLRSGTASIPVKITYRRTIEPRRAAP
jgi:hypothetical protein